MLIAYFAVVFLGLYEAVALCPANGNTHVLYATTNMGHNIATFDTMGRYLGDAIDLSSLPADYRVDKLRSMVNGPDGNLYVTSARGAYSKIFAVSGNGVLNNSLNTDCTRRFLFSVAELSPSNPYMDHPYGMLFHPEDQSIYVSNQNTVTITRYLKNRAGTQRSGEVSQPPEVPTWRPAPVSAGVTSGLAPGAAAPPPNSGLFASDSNTKYTLNSIRGIALSPLLPRRLVEGSLIESAESAEVQAMSLSRRYYLAACDPVSNSVHVFDAADGTFVFSLSVKSPIQLAFPSAAFAAGAAAQPPNTGHTSLSTAPLTAPDIFIYVTSKDDGMLYKMPFRVGGDKFATSLTPKAAGQSLSGIAENAGHGVLYVADRNGKRISVYTTPSRASGGGAANRQRGSSSEERTTRGEGAASAMISEGSYFLGNFHVDLPDQPEFLMLTQVEQQKNIPMCYELGPFGGLRYTALCLAVDLWMAVLGAVMLSLAFLYVRNILRKHLEASDAEKRRRQKLFHVFEETADTTELLRKGSRSDVPSYGGMAGRGQK